MNEETLSHHGILGMHWGVRNGPPYPLSSGAHSVSEKKAGWQRSLESVTGIKVGRNTNRVTVTPSRSVGTSENNEPKTLSDEDKIKVVRSGNPKAVEYFKYELTQQEMREAIERINWQKTLDEASLNKKGDIFKSIDKYTNSARSVYNAAKTTSDIYKMVHPDDNDKQNKEETPKWVENVIRSGDPDKLKEYQSGLSTKQFEEAVKRINWNEKYNEKKKK